MGAGAGTGAINKGPTGVESLQCTGDTLGALRPA